MTTKAESLSGIEGIESSKVIKRNTFEVVYCNGDRAIRLHKTDVIVFKCNGNVVLNSGGWRTVTTKERINAHLNYAHSDRLWRVYQVNRVWYVNTSGLSKDVLFYDGMEFNTIGNLLSEEKQADVDSIKKTKAAISKFVALVDKLENIPMPNGGDCWQCYGIVRSDDNEHLQSHIDEDYLHGSLIANALREQGYIENWGFIMQMNCKAQIKRALRRYLGKRLLKQLAY